MKKTEKTALTAAVFAAALNLIPSGTAAPQTVQAADDVPRETVVYPVYGTIPAWTTAPATETKTDEGIIYPVYGVIPAWTTTPVTETKPAETIIYPVYGVIPAWTTAPVTVTEPDEWICYPVYGTIPAWQTTTKTKITTSKTTAANAPLPMDADINGDGRIDTYDYLLMRQYITNNSDVWYCDLNGDGETDIADLVRMQRYLLGGDEPYDPYQWVETPLYGPPVAFERNTSTTASDYFPED